MAIVLGIDIGTTSVKVNCTKFENESTFQVIKRTSLPYEHHSRSQCFSGLNTDNVKELIEIGEINPYLVLSSLVFCIEQFDVSLRRQINAIGITGAMHGCLFWTEQCLNRIRSIDSGRLNFDLNFNNDYENLLTNLITWEDDRCDKRFLDSLPGNSNAENRKAHSGYGIATTYWLLRNRPNYLNNYCYMGSIMDFVVHLLCTDLKHPVTSTQLANSYGYFDMKTNNWSSDLDEQFPKHILPTVLSSDDQLAGKLNYRSFEINVGVPVFVAYGDLQCAIYSAMINKTQTAILNSGTSMQLAFPIGKNKLIEKLRSTQLIKSLSDKIDLPITDELSNEKFDSCSKIQVEIVPYFRTNVENEYLITCSTLNGGNVIAFFIKSIAKFMSELVEIELDENRIWSRVSELARRYLDKIEATDQQERDNELTIEPRLFGERYEVIKSKLSIRSIGATNFELGQIYWTLCSSLIDNVFTMCPVDLLSKLNIDQICSVGSTLQKNEILKECLQRKLTKHKLKLKFENNAEADLGISMITMKHLNKLN